MYHLENIAYIVLLVLIIVSPLFIWTIIGRPRIVKRKQWTTPRVVSTMLSADVAEEIRKGLDECEQSIS